MSYQVALKHLLRRMNSMKKYYFVKLVAYDEGRKSEKPVLFKAKNTDDAFSQAKEYYRKIEKKGLDLLLQILKERIK